jgi:hypothetical protein
MRGTKGIVTALHGVLGATTIDAENDNGDLLQNLKVGMVDVANDLALLTSPELSRMADDGFDPGKVSSLTVGNRLKVYGHPAGISTHEKLVAAGNPVLKTLHDLRPLNSAQAFTRRGSPLETIKVLNIDGSLVVGDSGAPILDDLNEVVAVGNGGVLGGAAGISWAIPIRDVHWVSYSQAQEIGRLIDLDPRDLYELEVTAELPVEIIPEGRGVRVSDFGQFPQLEWQRPLSLVNSTMASCKKIMRVLSVNDCNLEVEDETSCSFPPNTGKINITRSIPLRRIKAESTNILENHDPELGPENKWGVTFFTPSQEIDTESITVSELEGQPRQESHDTRSIDGLFLIVGTRKEAIAFKGVAKQAIARCHPD